MANAVLFGGMGIQFENGSAQQFLQWLLHISLHSPSSVFDLCLMILWLLWKNVNDALWNGSSLLPHEVVFQVEGWLHEYHKWHKVGARKVNRPLPRSGRNLT